MVNFPSKWRGRIRIPVQHITISINSELCWIKPCIPAQYVHLIDYKLPQDGMSTRDIPMPDKGIYCSLSTYG